MRSPAPSPWKFLRLVIRLRKLKPAIVHTWMYHADLLGGLGARMAGVRAIGWRVNHSNLDPQLNKRTTLWVVRICARLSTWLPRRILSCSEKARRVHVAAGYAADKIVVVPNGIDLGRFLPDAAARESVRAELGLEARTPLWASWRAAFREKHRRDSSRRRMAHGHPCVPLVGAVDTQE
jgi:glycosyltransferase involved in cell wall biosynthesis